MKIAEKKIRNYLKEKKYHDKEISIEKILEIQERMTNIIISHENLPEDGMLSIVDLQIKIGKKFGDMNKIKDEIYKMVVDCESQLDELIKNI